MEQQLGYSRDTSATVGTLRNTPGHSNLSLGLGTLRLGTYKLGEAGTFIVNCSNRPLKMKIVKKQVPTRFMRLSLERLSSKNM